MNGFGLVWMNFFPWVYHTTLGWVYVVEGNDQDDDSFWMFIPDVGWVWTRPFHFPYLWRHSDQSWLFFEEESELPDGRLFFNFTTETVEGSF